MKCINCGRKLTGEENFCRICGTPIEHSKNEEEKNNFELTNNIDISNLNVESLKKDFLFKDLSEKKVKEKEIETQIEEQEEKNIKTDIQSDSIKNKFVIHSTQELLIDNPDSSNKIKKILEDLKSSNDNFNEENEKDDDNFKTAMIPSDLINDYSKSKKKIEELEKTKIDKELKEELKNETEEEKIIEEEKTNEQDECIVQCEDDNIEKEEIVVKEEKKVIVDEEDDEIEFEESKNSKFGIVFVSILLVLSLGVIAFLVFTLSSKDSQLKKAAADYDELASKTGSNIQQPSNNNSNSSKSTTNLVTYNDYQLPIQEKITIKNGNAIFKYNSLNLIMSISNNNDYLTLKQNKDEYKTLLLNNGYIVESYGTKVVDEREYVIYEANDSSNKALLIAYTKLNENDIVCFVIENSTNKINYDDLNKINTLLTKMKKGNNSQINSSEFFIKK